MRFFQIMIQLLLLFQLLFFSCNNKKPETTGPDAVVNSEKAESGNEQVYSFEIFQEENNYFGYNILKNGKVIIHQPYLPGVTGKRGFSSREDAEKVASLAVKKIEHQIFPPTISTEELDSLGVLN